jgi:hypothetical protein
VDYQEGAPIRDFASMHRIKVVSLKCRLIGSWRIEPKLKTRSRTPCSTRLSSRHLRCWHLTGPDLPFIDSRLASGTDGSNPVPSTGESANPRSALRDAMATSTTPQTYTADCSHKTIACSTVDEFVRLMI